jgi:SAM-dependent methyltransferase
MTVYDHQFWNHTQGRSLAAARVVVPRLIRLLHPRSVVDVGCGTGIWLAEFLKDGVEEILGIDGPWVPDARLRIPPDRLLRHDLTGTLAAPRQFDLVLCLGVGEHLPETAAETLVATLSGLGSVVIFSAAATGPRENGLVNEQPGAWWDQLFDAHRYRPHRAFGARLVGNRDVDESYSRLLVVYDRPGAAEGIDLDLQYLDGPPRAVQSDMVLPVIMTCARDVSLTRRFVESYTRQLGAALPSPVISVDLTAGARLPGDYVSLLDRLGPAVVTVHSRVLELTERASINDAAFAVLASGMAEIGDREYLLFIEDDVLFSGQFLPFLSRLRLERDAGFYTLYQPFSGYGSAQIEPRRFFGTQCLLFPKNAVAEILKDRHSQKPEAALTYDLQWSRILASCGYKLYGALESYVQHIAAPSRYGSGSHRSGTFVG